MSLRLSCLALLLLAAACAPLRQLPVTTPDRYGAPRIEDDAFVSFDGARLGLQSWLPEEGEPKAVIAALHGMTDYSETWFLAGPYWAGHGYAVYAYDQRGFGRSPQRGVWPDRETMLADVAYFVAALRAQHPGKEVVLVGTSMGAAASLAALNSSTPPDVDRLVLVSPAVWGWSTMNLAYQAALRVAAAFAPGWTLTGESLEIWPTDNIEVLRKMAADPLMIVGTRVDALTGLVDMMDAGWKSAPPDGLPTLILMGEKDEVVPTGVIEDFARERAPDACFTAYENGYHMLERDLQAQAVWDDIEGFIGGTCPPARR